MKSNENEDIDWIGILVGVALAMFMGAVIGGGCTLRIARQDAVKAGAAYWTVDQISGTSEFHWGKP